MGNDDYSILRTLANQFYDITDMMLCEIRDGSICGNDMDRYTEFRNTLEEKYINRDGIETSEGVISLYDLVDLFDKAYSEDTSKSNSINGSVN